MQPRAYRDRRRGLPGRWIYWECSRCKVVFQYPAPSDPELQAYYVSYSSRSDLPLALSSRSRLDSLRRLYHAVTGDVDPRDFVPIVAQNRVLDYGCGVAPYLAYFQSRGMKMSGAEITLSVVDTYRAAGFDVRLIERLDCIPFPDGEFDAVYMMQVFEHIAHPHEFLREIHRVLKTGGILYAAMPNARSLWRKVFRTNWVSGWFPPFHIFVYNRASITALATGSGFEVIRAWSSTPESWFRLNLKAAFFRSDDKLDGVQRTWLDVAPTRIASAVVLRMIELFVRERDCLVVQLKRTSGPPKS